MRKNELTVVKAETLRFITQYINQHGYSPTIADLADAVGVRHNAIAERLARLLRKGAITKKPGIARSVRPV
ncbi:LexA family protein [Pseudomonas graminis]|uniref:LexA family protein n=1 Tax=Pseudomonas graminis TaxID=158627 RepID=UPI000944F13C